MILKTKIIKEMTDVLTSMSLWKSFQLIYISQYSQVCKDTDFQNICNMRSNYHLIYMNIYNSRTLETIEISINRQLLNDTRSLQWNLKAFLVKCQVINILGLWAIKFLLALLNLQLQHENVHRKYGNKKAWKTVRNEDDSQRFSPVRTKTFISH